MRETHKIDKEAKLMKKLIDVQKEIAFCSDQLKKIGDECNLLIQSVGTSVFIDPENPETYEELANDTEIYIEKVKLRFQERKAEKIDEFIELREELIKEMLNGGVSELKSILIDVEETNTKLTVHEVQDISDKIHEIVREIKGVNL